MQSIEYFKQLKTEFKAILKAIKDSDRIVIFRHKVPDYDAFGTQMGLYTWIKENYPEKEVHYVGESHHAFVPRLFPQPEVLGEEFYSKPYLAIIVDTGNLDRVSELNLSNATQVIRIDHHPEVAPENWGDIKCIHPEMAAASELVALMLQSIGTSFSYRGEMSSKAAEYFFIGIVGDSGRFKYPEVSSMTFRVTADLIDCGIDKDAIYRKMYLTPIKELEFKKLILNSYKVTEKGTLYYIMTDEMLKQFNFIPGEGKLGLDNFRDIEGIYAEVSITEDVKEGNYRLSFRSSCKHVSKVAQLFEGGGHAFAAGGKLKSLDELPRLLEELDNLEIVVKD
jgi:phosphoesterase RecJ-like protein